MNTTNQAMNEQKKKFVSSMDVDMTQVDDLVESVESVVKEELPKPVLKKKGTSVFYDCLAY